jgi:hypothetical protein
VLPVLRRMPRIELVTAVGLSGRRLRDVLNERARSHPGTEAVLTQAAASFARDRLRWRGLSVPSDDLAVCAAYLRRAESCA